MLSLGLIEFTGEYQTDQTLVSVHSVVALRVAFGKVVPKNVGSTEPSEVALATTSPNNDDAFTEPLSTFSLIHVDALKDIGLDAVCSLEPHDPILIGVGVHGETVCPFL